MFSETVSLYFKSGLFNMEIWESGIASGGFDIKITWFEKKMFFWVRVSFWAHDYHGAQTALELK